MVNSQELQQMKIEHERNRKAKWQKQNHINKIHDF